LPYLLPYYINYRLSNVFVLQYCFIMAWVLLLLSMIVSTPTTTTTSPNAASATSTNNSSDDNIRAAQRAHNWTFGIYVVLLGLTVFGTYLVWKSGNKVQDAVQAEASARISEANRGASEANQKAATATQTANEAHERAGNLEHDNLILRGDLNTEIGKVAGLQKSAADAKAAQQKVEIELAKQQERTAIAERNLLQLREYLKDRTISNEQQRKFVAFLNQAKKDGMESGKVMIWWVSSDPDSYPLAMQLKSMLNDAGWNDVTDMMMVSAIGSGFSIGVRDLKAPPTHAGVLQGALRAAGIPATPYQDPYVLEGAVSIGIAHKPPVP
jgi:F0F1-type ATP synthase membrane subunit b/b'